MVPIGLWKWLAGGTWEESSEALEFYQKNLMGHCSLELRMLMGMWIVKTWHLKFNIEGSKCILHCEAIISQWGSPALFVCEISPSVSCVWVHCLQLLTQFGELGVCFGHGVYLEHIYLVNDVSWHEIKPSGYPMYCYSLDDCRAPNMWSGFCKCVYWVHNASISTVGLGFSLRRLMYGTFLVVHQGLREQSRGLPF